MRKVKVNRLYRYQPALYDLSNPPYGANAGLLKPGDTVKVVNMYGCPPANSMGHCHIENPETGDLLGLVQTVSLIDL